MFNWGRQSARMDSSAYFTIVKYPSWNSKLQNKIYFCFKTLFNYYIANEY